MALTKVGSGVIQDDAVGIANLGATGTASRNDGSFGGTMLGQLLLVDWLALTHGEWSLITRD